VSERETARKPVSAAPGDSLRDSEGTCLLGTGSTTTLAREYREESQLMNKHAHTDKYQAKQL
jgi:hypothetical protein